MVISTKPLERRYGFFGPFDILFSRRDAFPGTSSLPQPVSQAKPQIDRNSWIPPGVEEISSDFNHPIRPRGKKSRKLCYTGIWLSLCFGGLGWGLLSLVVVPAVVTASIAVIHLERTVLQG